MSGGGERVKTGKVGGVGDRLVGECLLGIVPESLPVVDIAISCPIGLCVREVVGAWLQP